MKMSLRDARLQVMRGNLDPKVVKKEESPEPVVEAAPVPVKESAPSVTIDTSPIAQAMTSQAMLIAQAMGALKPEPNQPAPTHWTFKITSRDARGNIVAFTAEAK